MLNYYVNETDTFEGYVANMPTVLGEWEKKRTGPLSNTLTNFIGWTRVEKNDPVLKKYGDSASGPNSPHIELIFSVCGKAAGFYIESMLTCLLEWVRPYGGYGALHRQLYGCHDRHRLAHLPLVFLPVLIYSLLTPRRGLHNAPVE